MIASIYRKDPNNIGDYCCSPCDYFKFPEEIKRIDVKEAKPHNLREFSSVIFGGGGMLVFDKQLKLLAEKNNKSIFWGIGLNKHGATSDDYPSWLSSYFNGTRDRTAMNWVPCPSCMSELFDVKREPTHEVIAYEHKSFPLPINDFPKIDNGTNSFPDAIAFLQSGKIILTNSYHGAYWGILLGRTVVIVDPFSSKFFYFKHQPIITTIGKWRNDIKKATPLPETLNESRIANTIFYEKVIDFLY